MLDIYVESRLCEGELGFLSVLPGVEGVAGFFFLLIVKSERKEAKKGVRTGILEIVSLPRLQTVLK